MNKQTAPQRVPQRSIPVSGLDTRSISKTEGEYLPTLMQEQPSRRLTLTYSAYDHHRDGLWTGSCRYPVLRLSGLWLQRAGFNIGQRVQVRVHAGRLEIVPAV